MGPTIIAVAVFAVVVAVFLGTTISARSRAPIERGLAPVYEQMCSGRVGRFAGANYPAIRLSIYESFLVIAFLGTVVIPFKDIARAEIRRALFSSCLVIESVSGTTYRLSIREPQRVLRLLGRT